MGTDRQYHYFPETWSYADGPDAYAWTDYNGHYNRQFRFAAITSISIYISTVPLYPYNFIGNVHGDLSENIR